MTRLIYKTSLLIVALVLLPLAQAHAADGFTLPTREDDVEPLPESLMYAGWGYVCGIHRKQPGIVHVSLQEDLNCNGYTDVTLWLCSAENLDLQYCPKAEDPYHLRDIYSESELAMTVGLLREAMAERFVVLVWRNPHYGYIPAYTGANGAPIGHRPAVRLK